MGGAAGLWVSDDDTAAYQADAITQCSLRAAASSSGADMKEAGLRNVRDAFGLKEFDRYMTGLQIASDTPFVCTLTDVI